MDPLLLYTALNSGLHPGFLSVFYRAYICEGCGLWNRQWTTLSYDSDGRTKNWEERVKLQRIFKNFIPVFLHTLPRSDYIKPRLTLSMHTLGSPLWVVSL